MSNTEQISEELSLEIRTLEKRLKLINKALKAIAVVKMIFGVIVLSLLGFIFITNHPNWDAPSLRTLGLTWILCLSAFSISWCLHSIIDKWAFVVSIPVMQQPMSIRSRSILNVTFETLAEWLEDHINLRFQWLQEFC